MRCIDSSMFIWATAIFVSKCFAEVNVSNPLMVRRYPLSFFSSMVVFSFIPGTFCIDQISAIPSLCSCRCLHSFRILRLSAFPSIYIHRLFNNLVGNRNSSHSWFHSPRFIAHYILVCSCTFSSILPSVLVHIIQVFFTLCK